MAKEEKLVDLSTIILLIALIIAGIAFYYFLDKVNNIGFSIWEILFAVAFAFFVTAYLIWAKSIEMNNAYLGTGIGLIGLILLVYGISLKYKGAYTTTFLIIGAIIILAYISYNFFKFKDSEKLARDEYED